MGKGKLLGTLAALATIAGLGIAVVQLLKPGPPPPRPARPLGLLERSAGNYELVTWTPKRRPISLGCKVASGTLTIRRDGSAEWEVEALQTSTRDPGRVRVTMRAQLDIANRLMNPATELPYANVHHFDGKWPQLSQDQNLAITGSVPGQNDLLRLDAEESTTPLDQIQLSNSRGIYTWRRQ